MSQLPVIYDGLGAVCVIDPDTGELVPLTHASDHAIASAAEQLHDHDGEILRLRRCLAAEMRSRYGVGKTFAGGYSLTVAESQSWPAGPVKAALTALLASNTITEADAERCMPSKPRPDATQIKALVGRLTVADPVAAKVLADAATISAPSLRDVCCVAVEEEADAA